MADDKLNDKRTGPLEALGQPWSNPTLVTPAWMGLISDLIRGAGRGTLEDLHRPVETSRLPLGRTMPMPIYRAPGGPVVREMRSGVPLSEADRVMPIQPDASWSERVIEPLNRRQYEAHDRNLLEIPSVGGSIPEFNTPVYDPYTRKTDSPAHKIGFGDGGDVPDAPRVPGPIDENGREVLFNNVGETPSGDYLSRVARDARHGLGHLTNVGWDARGWGVGNLDLILSAIATKGRYMPKRIRPNHSPDRRPELGYGRARGGPIGYAGGGWAGEMDEMGMSPSEVAPKPGRPDLSQVGFFGKHTPWEGVKKLYRETVDNPSIPAMLSGAPGFAQGYEKVTDENAGVGRKVSGATQMAVSAIPYGSRLAGPIGSGIEALTATTPRMLATYGTLGTLGNAENIADAFAPGAQAQGAEKWTPPTEQQKKNRSWVMQQQDELIKRGLYPKNDPTYGSYGGATESGLKRLWQMERDAERDRVRQEKLESDRLAIERGKADAATKEANTKEAEEKRKERERKANEDRIGKADTARNEVSKAESPYVKYPRLIAPTLLGIGAGILSGGKMAKSSAAKGRENAITQQEAANKILKGADPSINEKIGKVNQFAQQGQQEPAKGWFGTQVGARPAKENWFVPDNETAKSAPYWMANLKAPQSSALYPESRAGEHVRNAMLPGGIGGVEFGLGTAGDLYYSGQIADQEKIINDKLSTADAVRAAAANKSDYEWKKALSEFVQRTGATTALYGAGKGSHAIASRPPMRPNVAKADTWRGEINTSIGNARGKEAAAAKAERAERAAEKARREATNPAAPPAGPAPRNRRRGPNGGGAAPLLPLAAGPMLSGDRGTREPYPELTGGASEDSYNDEGFGRPYATGGEVGEPVKRHHSYFQPRKVGRFSGGPVYREVNSRHHSHFQPRNVGRFSGGPVWPRINRFDGGQIDIDPLREAAKAATHGIVLGALGPAMDRRHRGAAVDVLGYGSDRDDSVGRFAKPGLADPLQDARRAALAGAPLGALGPALRLRQEPGQDYARGGATEGHRTPSVPHTAGPVEGRTGGRTDALNMTVAPGAYVVPAHVVSNLPGAEGNTGAGMAILTQHFGPAQRSPMAQGGVGIKISDGEYVLSPEQVAKVGGGDIQHGHRVLDALCRRIQKHAADTIRKLPPPATN